VKSGITIPAQHYDLFTNERTDIGLCLTAYEKNLWLVSRSLHRAHAHHTKVHGFNPLLRVDCKKNPLRVVLGTKSTNGVGRGGWLDFYFGAGRVACGGSLAMGWGGWGEGLAPLAGLRKFDRICIWHHKKFDRIYTRNIHQDISNEALSNVQRADTWVHHFFLTFTSTRNLYIHC
jgi:hypothetical protein